MITTSEKIGELAKALHAASKEIGGALKDAKNPHFKSEYATLASIVNTAKPALDSHGFSVIQSPGELTDGSLHMRTRLIHESGEWIETLCEVPLGKKDPQGVGSAITYARRYALAAALNIPVVDDDGEAATQRGAPKPETITTDEAIALEGRMKELGVDQAPVLQMCKVESLRQLTPDLLAAVHKKLDATERARAAEKTEEAA